jgi:hypothetical protein
VLGRIASQSCSGTDALTGHPIQLAFDDRLLSTGPGTVTGSHLAPGFIDLQVNGFAGVDYNDPHTPHEEIGRSLRAKFAAGVSRLYATIGISIAPPTKKSPGCFTPDSTASSGFSSWLYSISMYCNALSAPVQTRQTVIMRPSDG